MMSLANTVTLWDDDPIGSLYRSAHIGLQLCTMHLTILVDGVDFAIVIEEHRKVVDVALHIMMLPRATNILRCVALQPLAIDI